MIVLDDIIIREKQKDNYVALGSFDGVHQGHMTLIKRSVEVAKLKDGNSMVFTYKNHPRTLINPMSAPKLIMDLDTKLDILKEQEIDIVVLRDFTEKFMKMNPEDFIKLLCEEYNVKGIIVGFNFRFGYKNAGDIKLLERLKVKYGYELFVLEPYYYDEEVISSTRIRKLILDGNIEKANEMLPRLYCLKGKVKHGRKLGRTIGFPTANLEYSNEMIIPKIGVYYTNIIYENEKYKGITSIGNNPTVEGKELTIETYILDFEDEVYGEEIEVYFIERIRDEKKFDSLEQLVVQLRADKEFAMYHGIFI